MLIVAEMFIHDYLLAAHGIHHDRQGKPKNGILAGLDTLILSVFVGNTGQN